MNFKGGYQTSPCSYFIMLESLKSEAVLKFCFPYAYLILIYTIF
jgi:hypothetical protein